MCTEGRHPLVWSPQYQRDVLQGEVQRRVQELLQDALTSLLRDR